MKPKDRRDSSAISAKSGLAMATGRNSTYRARKISCFAFFTAAEKAIQNYEALKSLRSAAIIQNYEEVKPP
jgi:hypothetical protein